MHHESDQISLGIGDDVALSALDFSCLRHSPWATASRGFYRLAFNHAGRWARLSANRLARCHNETVVQRGNDSAARPRIEIALHRRVGWKVLGRLPPLATG